MKKIIDQLWNGQLSLSHTLQSARAEDPTLASSQTSCYFVTVTGKYLASSDILDRIQPPVSKRSWARMSFTDQQSRVAKNRPWVFFGKPKDGDMKDNYTYAHPDENNIEEYLRISIRSRQRKPQEEDIEHRDNNMKWWGANVSAPLKFQPEV